jgi:hypothetical protein
MYGGLFGDLPAAKGQESNEKETTTDATDANARVPQNKTTDKKEDTGAAWTDANKKQQSSSANTMFMAPAAARKKPKTAAKPGSSFSQSIGAAGTSMAFVPATVKRKKSRFAKLLETPKTTTPVAATAATTTASSTFQAVIPVPCPPPEAPSAASKTETNPVINTPFVSTTTSIIQASQQAGPIDIHAPQEQQEQGKSKSSFNATISASRPNSAARQRMLLGSSSSHREEIIQSQEDEEEEEITDPYDPYVPNDLLQYWDRQAVIQEQQQLEQETRKALEQQRVLREQLESERQTLQRQGNLEQLTSSGMGRGRGRGGVSNLPAWLVAKQQQEQKDGLLGELA